ncbi:YdgA family protein [Alcanivorax sp. JB21]|uniref:DUF945 family protein n=1 Tax=Alcanivorax limicola TaxID=2874102 RepID=UPI001CC0C8EA|nr:DUF945 family protein [Alcanivorax limicola]MBZ2190136.1 YdgA family protein [Alcanivorax limicola]
MKKIIVGLLVVAIVWIGSSYLVGARVETLYTDALAEMEVLPGQDGLRFRVVEYRRGIFSSQVRSCLTVDETLPKLAAFSGYVCDKSTLRHGPVMWTSSGPWAGLAFSHGELDMAPLPDDIRSVIADVLGDESPLYAETWLSFDRSARVRAWVPEISFASGEFSASLARLELDAYMTSMTGDTGKVFLVMRELALNGGPEGELTIAAVDMTVDVVDMIEGILPLLQVQLRANGIRAGRDARQPWEDDAHASFDLALDATSALEGDALSGTMSLWLTDVVADSLDIPLDHAYMALAYRGIDRDAMVRIQQLSDDIDRLQSQMMVNLFAEPDGLADDMSADELFAQMTALTEEMAVVLSERLLRPGESSANVQLMLDNAGVRQVSLNAQVDYQGLNGSNVPLDEQASLDEAQILHLVNASLSLDVDETLLPAGQAEFAAEMVSAELATLHNGRYGMTLTVKDGELVFNGGTLTAAEFMERLSPLRTGGDVTVLDIEACYGEDADSNDIPDYCYEIGIYPGASDWLDMSDY